MKNLAHSLLLIVMAGIGFSQSARADRDSWYVLNANEGLAFIGREATTQKPCSAKVIDGDLYFSFTQDITRAAGGEEALNLRADMISPFNFQRSFLKPELIEPDRRKEGIACALSTLLCKNILFKVSFALGRERKMTSISRLNGGQVVQHCEF